MPVSLHLLRCVWASPMRIISVRLPYRRVRSTPRRMAPDANTAKVSVSFTVAHLASDPVLVAAEERLANVPNDIGCDIIHSV